VIRFSHAVAARAQRWCMRDAQGVTEDYGGETVQLTEEQKRLSKNYGDIKKQVDNAFRKKT
jgi:hypothetical protein